MQKISKKPLPSAIEQIRLDLKSGSADYASAVERLLAECSVPALPGVTPVVAIAERLGFGVYSANFKNADAVCTMCDAFSPVNPFNQRRVIVVNANEQAIGKQLAIAHELGHFMLHCSDTHEFYERLPKELHSGRRSQQEDEANRFATELLMPKRAVRVALEDLQFSLMSVKACFLSKTFLVSEKMALKRLGEIENL